MKYRGTLMKESLLNLLNGSEKSVKIVSTHLLGGGYAKRDY